MAFSFQLTNTIASPALRGQNAIVTIAQTELTKFGTLAVGNKAVASSSGNIGYITEIDAFGYSFKVKPAQDSGRFDSIAPGLLNANEIITITQ